ncbi:putative nuclease HARBI1 [Sparus aurata]|uniref:putative nuclease HARBI1 n=1 Tax=Sparus aurata TaxID=8175 RepID=UPI0011C17559|nr:putative nuclease HARBI1 [Sparus aurata]
MACPFLEDVLDDDSPILRRAFRHERVFRDRSDPLAFGDDYLIERYRFSGDGLRYLCRLLGPKIQPQMAQSHALTVPMMVCVTLRFFACGSFLHSVGDAENLNKETICRTIRHVCLALKSLLNMFVGFPSHLSTMLVKEGFYKISGFPRIIGAMDCTHVPIIGPLGEHEADYVNRKSIHSISVQMTCDQVTHQSIVTSVVARWPGSVHDSRIFRESALGHQLQQGLFDGLLVGDRGYACTQLMTPYPDPDTPPQSRVNAPLGKCRVRIEMTFGVIKCRFNCLRGLRVRPERACGIITACVVLHNIAMMRKEQTPHAPLVAAADIIDPVMDHPTTVAGSAPKRDTSLGRGSSNRDDITFQRFQSRQAAKSSDGIPAVPANTSPGKAVFVITQRLDRRGFCI